MIPAVDLGRDDAPERLRSASEQVGFFTVVGHGVPSGVIEQIASVSRQSLDWGPSLDGVDWPVGLQRPYVAYLQAMHALARRLRGVIARSLGRPEAWFEDRFDERSSTLRVINYPEPEVEPEPGQLRAGAHRDYGFLTILRSDDALGGLEVQTPDGAWAAVSPPPGSFVCKASRRYILAKAAEALGAS